MLWALPRWADVSNLITLALGLGACAVLWAGWELEPPEAGGEPQRGAAHSRRTRTAPVARAPSAAVEMAPPLASAPVDAARL